MGEICEGAGVDVCAGRHHKATAEHITVVPTPERRSQKCEGLAKKHVEEGRVGLGPCGWALASGLDPTPGVIGMPLGPEVDVTVWARLLCVTQLGWVGKARSHMLPSVSSAARGRSWLRMYSKLSWVVARMRGL